MDREEKHFELLRSEKHHADAAITSYADRHLKLFAFLGAGVVLLGWLYGDTAHANQQSLDARVGVVCLALAVISCGIVVHGISTYALTLGYIHYKNQVLNLASWAVLASTTVVELVSFRAIASVLLHRGPKGGATSPNDRRTQ